MPKYPMKVSLLLCFVVIAAMAACKQEDKCAGVVCLSPVELQHSVRLRLLSATDSTDLLFGPDRRYNADSLQLNLPGVMGISTGYASPTPHTDPPPDSILTATIYNRPDTVLLRLSDGDVDTIAVRYRSSSNPDPCCAGTVKLAGMRYNGLTEVEVASSGVIVLYK